MIDQRADRRGALADPARLGLAERGTEPRQYPEQVRVLQAHAGVFLVGMAVIVGVNLVTNLAAGIAGSWSAWWSLWALIGWSAGVAIHGLVVWLHRPTLLAGETVGRES